MSRGLTSRPTPCRLSGVSYKDPARQREFCRLWARKRRAAWFAGKRCAVCGSTERLELDHVDPGQKTSHRIWSWSKPRFEAEVAKCQVLCSDCHKTKTYGYSPREHAPHGTRSHYRWGCRCAPCRRANAELEHERRTRKRGAA